MSISSKVRLALLSTERLSLPWYLALLWYHTRAELQSELQKTYLSFSWWILEPLLYITAYYLAFAVLLQGGGEDFMAILMVGVVTFQLFARGVSRGAGSIKASAHVIKKIRIEKLFFPSAVIASDGAKFLVALVVLIAAVSVIHAPPGLAIVWLPLVLLQELLFVSAVVFWISLAVPFIDDVRLAVPVLLTGSTFLSGVFFSVERVPEAMREYFLLNPLAAIIENWRLILLHDTAPDIGSILWVSVGSLIACALALAWSRRFSSLYVRLVSQ